MPTLDTYNKQAELLVGWHREGHCLDNAGASAYLGARQEQSSFRREWSTRGGRTASLAAPLSGASTSNTVTTSMQALVRTMSAFLRRRPPFNRSAVRRARRVKLALLLLSASPAAALAQWLDYPTPGIPRTEDGAPDMGAPAPRTAEGKPDFSGMWFANVPSRDMCSTGDCIQEERMAREQINLGVNLEGGLPYTEWSQEQMVQRRANGGLNDPHMHCLPPNFPRAWTLPQYIKIVQTRDLMVMLHEFNAAYREVFMDGRPLPEDPNPTWNGYSTAHWEGDTLVIETHGIRDDMWLDIQGSPVTESARVTERLTRLNFGLMQVEIAVDDPKAYTKPWSVTIEMAYQPDTTMLEEICLDDEQNVDMHLPVTTSERE